MKRAMIPILTLLALLTWAAPVLAAPQVAPEAATFALPTYLLAWLWPVGVALVLVGISEGWSINDVAAMLPIALALAVLSEMLCGYGLYHGGALLGAEWEPFGPGWGLLGHAGLLASSETVSPALLYDLPRLTVALLPPLVILRGRGRPWVRYAVAVACGAVLVPLAGNWIAGGGWLQNLGETLGLGVAFTDAGLVSLPLVTTLATLLVALTLPRAAADEPAEAELRPAFLPLHVLLGALLAWLGWQALTQSATDLAGMLTVLWAAAGAVLFAAFYVWLVHGTAEPGLIGRGLLAGVIVTGAAVPGELGLLAAFALGALAGLGLAPLIYLFDRSLRLREQSGLLALFGVLGIVALLAPGLVGSTGGILTGHGPEQLYAQLLGLVALVLWGGGVPWAVTTLICAAANLPARLRERAAQERLRLEAQAALPVASDEQPLATTEEPPDAAEPPAVNTD